LAPLVALLFAPAIAGCGSLNLDGKSCRFALDQRFKEEVLLPHMKSQMGQLSDQFDLSSAAAFHHLNSIDTWVHLKPEQARPDGPSYFVKMDRCGSKILRSKIVEYP
jgi:hypothetical protein